MKFDVKEIVALLVVFLLPLGIGQFVAKTTLPEYGAAVQMMGSAGAQLECVGAQAECIAKSPELHIALASALEKVYAPLLGMPAASPQAIVGFLLVFPPLLLAISSVLIYLACRQMAYKKSQSVFAAVLFSLSSTVALSFMPGIYGSGQLAMLIFAAFLLPFAAFIQKPGRAEMLLAAAVLGFAAGYVNAAFAISGIAMAAAFAFAHQKKKEEKNYLVHLGLLALVFAAAVFLSPDKSALAFSAGNWPQAMDGMPFLFAGAAACLGLFFFGTRDSEYFALLLLGAALCGFSPLAAAILLVFPVAEGAARMMDDISKGAKLAAVFACAFFVVFGLVYGGMGIYPALGAALMLGVLAPLVLHFYDYNARAVFSVMGAALLLFSLFFAIFMQMPPAKAGYPDYTDPALAEALSYLAASGTASIATLERSDAVGFYLPSAKLEKKGIVGEFLSSGKAMPESGAYLLLSLDSIGALSEKNGFEVYYYVRNYTGNGITYALFISQQGRLISRELSSGGTLALKDGAALDGDGSYYAPIALTRMVMLNDAKSYADTGNRMLVLEDGGAAPPRLADICSGRYAGVKPGREFAGVMLYKVN